MTERERSIQELEKLGWGLWSDAYVDMHTARQAAHALKGSTQPYVYQKFVDAEAVLIPNEDNSELLFAVIVRTD